MHLKEDLEYELGMRDQAWVILYNVLRARNDSGELILVKVLAKHLFFFSLDDGEHTLVVDYDRQELVLNSAEVRQISKLVYAGEPLIGFDLDIPGSVPPIQLPCASSKLQFLNTLPENIVNAVCSSTNYSLKLCGKCR